MWNIKISPAGSGGGYVVLAYAASRSFVKSVRISRGAGEWTAAAGLPEPAWTEQPAGER